MRKILKCKSCGSYTISECKCDGEAVPVLPPKYSPEDRYGRLRRQAKFEERKKQGIL